MVEIGKYKNDVFIVAEVGQNHQGDPKIAMDYVEKFAMLGADAIKFQTRNNNLIQKVMMQFIILKMHLRQLMGRIESF